MDMNQPSQDRMTVGVPTSNPQMERILRCNAKELKELKDVVKHYMRIPEYDGEPLLGQDFERLGHEKKTRLRSVLWDRVANHNTACEELLSGARWSGADRPANFDQHLDAVKRKIMILHQSEAARRRKAAARRAQRQPVENEASEDSTTPVAVAPSQRWQSRKGYAPRERMNPQDEDDEEISSLTGEAAKHQPTVETSDRDYLMSGALQPSQSIQPEAAAPAQAATPASIAVPRVPAASPGEGPSFNDQMLLLTMQNQQMMLTMMKEIQELKKGRQ
ncbi:hypothetical protein HII31_13325 [Pseudocercospora fuligena]|uniref:Uncharacterized protein n=1 Tax=Pseudocercospora fuligena TaxID=685502 RepID=A0A8H6R8B3_9PEZI|nr:hypothetical protein HII31_13325 [Pseudocercospora fuligena]